MEADDEAEVEVLEEDENADDQDQNQETQAAPETNPPKTVPIKTQSKAISKNTYPFAVNLLQPVEAKVWRKYQYLKEVLKGKRFEVKRLKLELLE